MSLREVIDQTRILLIRYLEDANISISPSGSLNCINPQHDDTTTSAQINTQGDSDYMYCHSCHATYDIFAAAHILESLPDSGISWIEENVLALANRYGVEYDKISVSGRYEDPNYEMARKAYRDTANLVANSPLSEQAKEYVASHNWEPIVTEFGLGSIGVHELIDALVSSGHDSKFLDEISLTDRNLFHGDNLLFPIHDIHGRPIGFQARRFDTDKKYINSSGIGTYSPYSKRDSLFNIHRIRKTKDQSPLYIMEGQTDVITAHQYGIRAVSVQGSALSASQVQQINQLNEDRILICLDGDEAGLKAILKNIVPHAMTNCLYPVPNITLMPANIDPDEYIRANLTDIAQGELISLEKYFITDLYAKLLGSKKSPEKLCEELITLSSNYTSPITRGILAKSISNATDVAEGAIYARLEEIDTNRSHQVSEKRAKIIDGAVKDLTKKPEEATQILINTMDSLEKASHSQDALGSEKFLSYVKDIKSEEETRLDNKPGYTINGFRSLQKALDGDCSQKLIVIGGTENTGKSTIADALGYNIAQNPKNNAMLLSILTDDSVKERLPRYICLADSEVGEGVLSYIDVTNPNYNYDAATAKTNHTAREKAYQRFYELSVDERIVLKDIQDGASIDFVSAMVKRYRSKYPNRKLVVVVDSINRLRLPFGATDQRAATTYASNSLKEIAVKYNCTVIAVCEFNRPKGQFDHKNIHWPDNTRLAEARALEYDANAILLLYNDVHTRGEDAATILWRDPSGLIRPRVVICITKNKITRIKRKIFHDFDEVRALFTEIDIRTARKEFHVEKERLRKKEEEEGDSSYGGYKRNNYGQSPYNNTQSQLKASIIDFDS